MRKARLGLQSIEREAERLKTLLPESLAVGVAVYNSAAIAIGTGAYTALTFDSERWDNADFHSVVANTSRLTVPDGYDGWYAIAGHAVFDGVNVGARRMIAVRLNGATYIGNSRHPVGADATEMSVSTLYYLSDNGAGANDYVELMVYHDRGANLNILAVVNFSPEFRMVKI